MIIRILQTFEDIVWDPEASPQSVPPPVGAKSDNLRQREEKVRLSSHLTTYAKVSDQFRLILAGWCSDAVFVVLGRVLGEIQRS